MNNARHPFLLVTILWAACGGSKAPEQTTPETQPSEGEGGAAAEGGEAAGAEVDEDFPDFISDEVKNQAQTLYKIALDLKKEEKYEESLTHLEKVVTLHPRYASAFFTKGTVLRKLGRLEEAVAAFAKARELKPDYQRAWAMEGAQLLRLEKPQEALEPLRRALALDPRDTGSVMNLGGALKKLDRIDEAIAVYQEGLDASPEDPGIQNNLAIALNKQKRYEEAIIQLEDAVKRSPEDDRVRLNLAMALRKTERFADALPHYQKVLDLKGEVAGVLYDMGYCYDRLGKPKEARGIYERYVKAVKSEDPAAAKRVEDMLKRTAGK
jgi:tetratricopeptide (TPR) repeat protein